MKSPEFKPLDLDDAMEPSRLDAERQGATGKSSNGRAWMEGVRRKALLALVLLTTVAIMPAACAMVYVLLVDRYTTRSVISGESAGQLLAVGLSNGLFPRCLVETDMGYFSLVEGFSGYKGEALTLLIIDNQTRALSDGKQWCTLLVRSYP
jgi:hypothetical protein